METLKAWLVGIFMGALFIIFSIGCIFAVYTGEWRFLFLAIPFPLMVWLTSW